MANAKITFTKEHLARLYTLAVEMLFSGAIVKGLIGTTLTIYDLVHNTTVKTLIDINAGLKREITKIEDLDEWSMTDYQQKKLRETKSTQELVNLLIGYRKYSEQKDAERNKLAELKAKRDELSKSTMSPEAQLAALDAEIAALSDDAPSTEEIKEGIAAANAGSL